VPPELKQSITHILGMAMTYHGNVVAAAGGAVFLLDRDLDLKGLLPLSNELIENSICTDETAFTLLPPGGCSKSCTTLPTCLSRK
jgi:hypothetical protein